MSNEINSISRTPTQLMDSTKDAEPLPQPQSGKEPEITGAHEQHLDEGARLFAQNQLRSHKHAPKP
jgi:hypothetical protein